MKAPVMYGKFHITFVIAAYLLSTLLAFLLRFVSAEKERKALHVIGLILLLAEIFKQWYLTEIIHNGSYDWFHFPFQLCSIPMYLCVLLPFERSGHKGMEAFLFSFTLFAASFALAYPQDMLNSDIFLLLHSFLYHGMMLFIAFWTARVQDLDWRDFREAVWIFLICACIAEIINVIGYSCGGSPDMFYISPFTRTLQPVFRTIAAIAGRPFEIIFYLLCIIGANTLIFYLYLRARSYNERKR